MIKDDCSPHLSEDDAHGLLANGLATYRCERKTMPARLVLHKTSYFNPNERKKRLHPRALEFVREDGETSASDLARELVGLSKLNFNNTQFDSGDPITVGAARRVGDVLNTFRVGRR